MYFVNFANRFTRHNLSHRGLFAWRERERERERALTNKTGLGLVPLNEKNLAIQRKPWNYILCTSNPSTVLHAKRKCSRVKYY